MQFLPHRFLDHQEQSSPPSAVPGEHIPKKTTFGMETSLVITKTRRHSPQMSFKTCCKAGAPGQEPVPGTFQKNHQGGPEGCDLSVTHGAGTGPGPEAGRAAPPQAEGGAASFSGRWGPGALLSYSSRKRPWGQAPPTALCAWPSWAAGRLAF